MNEDRHAGCGFHQRHDMILVRMHPAGRQKTHDMQGAAIGPRLGDQLAQHRPAGQSAFLNRDIDAGQILRHDPAGADIHVTHFRIAHLSARQSDRRARGRQQGMGTFGQHAAVVGRPGLGDGVVRRGVVAVAPAVENAKQSGAGASHGGS